ncbi:MAG: hypothetical protein OSB63_02200 [Planctomycetota bacterium]|nr:hypothetical protein [Planctomycetota bacterium]
MITEKLLVLLLLCSLSWSCASELPIDDPSEGRWEQIVLEGTMPRRDLLLACEYAISQAGYPKGTTDALRGTVFSDWEVRLQPFRNKGMRYKAILRVSDSDGKIAVRSRVISERNIEGDDTLDSSAAEWEAVNDDQGQSRVLMQFLSSQLFLRGS